MKFLPDGGSYTHFESPDSHFNGRTSKIRGGDFRRQPRSLTRISLALRVKSEFQNNNKQYA